jgi:serine/threonine protein kinase
MIEYFKYTNNIVSSILDDIIDDIEVENSSADKKNNKKYLQKIYDFYDIQREYSHLQDIFTPDVFDEFEQIINNILLQNPIYLKNLYQLKKYSGDLSDITIRYGVFETNNFVVKIDDEYNIFVPELELMHTIGNGIVTPYNIVLPYFVRIVKQNKYKQNKNNTENKEAKHMHFSIQPRIKNTLSLRTWINLLSNRNYATSYYIQLCITISKSILFMHSHNIVHGDVKPDNILIDISTHRPYIIDFGLSGLHNSSQGTGGTQPFCCPETKNCSFTNSDTYVWTTNKKEYDLWSIAFIFSTIIIFKNSYTFYSDYPRSYFTEDYYINMFFLNRIPIHFREPFILVLSKKSDINLSNFVQLLEDSLTLTSPQ